MLELTCHLEQRETTHTHTNTHTQTHTHTLARDGQFGDSDFSRTFKHSLNGSSD